MDPSYLATYRSGELARRAAQAQGLLHACELCPRACGVDRSAAERGTCLVGAQAEVSSAGPHYGEEAPLVGHGGSGTIFFSSCNLRCVFCQNYDISQRRRGRILEPEALGRIMLELQEAGCHNINFVTPSHQVPAILAGLLYGVQGGLRVPLVYNTSAYDSVDALRLLDGVFDIYMPDLKTLDERCARSYLRASDYGSAARAALREMHRQVGDLELDERGLAVRGVLLRHLVMPAGLSATRACLEFVRDELSANTYVNLMAQWHPTGECRKFAELDRSLTAAEYGAALRDAEDIGLTRLDERGPRRAARWL